tara:strand:+ start:562 stop:969 length:408 start_codon:yes stop_codon:yes gene_type:complete
MINLKDIAQETRTAVIQFPGMEEFEVTVGLVTRQMSTKIAKESRESRFSETSGMPEERINEDKFVSKFVDVAIKGWDGFKGEYLKQLMPVDESKINDDDLVPFSHDNAVMLMKSSQQFDAWVNEVVFKLKNFRGK